MATIQEISDGAFAKSSKNQPGVSAAETEIATQIQRIVQGAFAVAAVVNPTKFAEKADVVGVASEWVRPVEAEAVIRIENAAFGEVVVVPYDDRLVEDPKPMLYEFGPNFIASIGQTNAPGAADTLTFWFARRPADLTTVDFAGDIDPEYPDAYLDLLMHQFAMYLAMKDGRGGEVEALTVGRDGWLQRYVSWLERTTPILRHRFATKRVYSPDTLKTMMGG